MLLINGANAPMTGTAMATYRSDVAYLHVDCSGNSGSATLWGSPDAASGRWMAITAMALGPNTTATGQVVGFYPAIRATVDWASGGANTAKIWVYYQGRTDLS